MSHSRVSFEEAGKRLRISCVPQSVRQKLALFLDTHSDANWEYLAEVLNISTLETQWVKDTVMHSRHGSPTFRLFEQHLVNKDLTLDDLIQGLQKIRNLACVRVLSEEYDNGAFDRELVELNNSICNSTTILRHSENCPSLHHFRNSPTMLCSAEYQRKLLSNAYANHDPGDDYCSSGSTYNSLEGVAGDTISYTQLDSFESGEFAAEFPAPMTTAMILAENRLPTLGCEEGCKALYVGNGNRSQDVPLDLSACYVKAGPQVKEEHARCCEQRQNSCEKKPCLHGRNDPQRRRNACAGHHGPCPHTPPDGICKPVKCDVKAEASAAPVGIRSPVTQERRMKNGGGLNARPEKPDVGKGGDNCCFCLSRSPWNGPNGRTIVADAMAAICMREPSPGGVVHPPSKRVTDPLSKEELESLEKDQPQTRNPDGTTPVRHTGSSYAVLQQKPFRKDSRSIRVFVTYSDDSKKHMKKVMQMCECLKNNNFSVSIDVRENHLLSQDKMGWFDKRFKVADYVLVLISPKYYSDVTEPDDGLETPQTESTLNTLYIHRCMQAEYMMSKCLNKRFVPVLMPGSTKEHVPCWLKNTTIYQWPDQYKNLFFYMMYPAEVISQFVRREQSAKTPTVTKTNTEITRDK